MPHSIYDAEAVEPGDLVQPSASTDTLNLHSSASAKDSASQHNGNVHITVTNNYNDAKGLSEAQVAALLLLVTFGMPPCPGTASLNEDVGPLSNIWLVALRGPFGAYHLCYLDLTDVHTNADLRCTFANLETWIQWASRMLGSIFLLQQRAAFTVPRKDFQLFIGPDDVESQRARMDSINISSEHLARNDQVTDFLFNRRDSTRTDSSNGPSHVVKFCPSFAINASEEKAEILVVGREPIVWLRALMRWILVAASMAAAPALGLTDKDWTLTGTWVLVALAVFAYLVR